nr:PITH domain-containing protein At3g04780 [Ipomoea trifida]
MNDDEHKQVDLLDFIDWSGVECLNQNSSHTLSNALKQGYREDEGLNLESDADEQLLIYIPFNQVVKLHSIAVKGPEEEGPKTVKLFANREHMGFSNVNDFPPSDMAELSVDNLKGKPVTLKYVKFQNVRSVTIFIEDNQSGTDSTKVQKILLYGTTQVYNCDDPWVKGYHCKQLCLLGIDEEVEDTQIEPTEPKETIPEFLDFKLDVLEGSDDMAHKISSRNQGK